MSGRRELTVASFNLHWGLSGRRGGYRPFDVVAACAEIDADVLVLQESWAPDDGVAQHEAVASALGYDVLAAPLARAAATPAPHLVSRPDPQRRKGDGDWTLALLSRRPMTGTRVVELPKLPTDPATRSILRADVDLDGDPLTVHGAHMAHLEMGVVLHRRRFRAALTPASEPGVLLGDMNMWGWCISAMVPKGWARAGGGPTFSVARPWHRIDHLLTTPSVELASSEVLADLGSDHFAIRGRVRLREDAAG
jgi:endonuclease/exonuclease/phosphatase family metal-dependent hydrolase